MSFLESPHFDTYMENYSEGRILFQNVYFFQSLKNCMALLFSFDGSITQTLSNVLPMCAYYLINYNWCNLRLEYLKLFLPEEPNLSREELQGAGPHQQKPIKAWAATSALSPLPWGSFELQQLSEL